MKKQIICLLLVLSSVSVQSQSSNHLNAQKKAVIASVDGHMPELTELSDKIWAYAEVALQEHKSSEALADYALKQGFEVQKGIAGMPTAFIASYGSGRPIIGILGEFDALPGISQKATSQKEPLKTGAAGHGCGHNLFGAGSLGAATAIKELIEKGELKGTVRFYGTPAEESIGGKIYMARDGFFDDLDVCMDWHPGADIKAGVQSSKAMVDFDVKFYGKAAHASGDPWNGRSAVDAMELFNHGVNMLREHVQPTVRMHYAIKSGGDVPNVVPEFANVWMWIRDSKRSGVSEVYARVQDIAKGAALMAGVTYELALNAGDHEILVNRTGGAALQKNLEALGDITYSNEEIEFAREIQKATGKAELGIEGKIYPLEETQEHPGGGSSDVGDVSWVVPVVRMRSTTAPIGTPWHSWPVVACGGMSIGHKGMLHAAKTLGMTMVDLYQNPKLVNEIKREFSERRGDYRFEAMLPDGPPPVPSGDKSD